MCTQVVIELMRLGVEVIACDRYADAPAMQVAHRSHVFSMLDKDALRKCVELEQPDFIIPEIEVPRRIAAWGSFVPRRLRLRN